MKGALSCSSVTDDFQAEQREYSLSSSQDNAPMGQSKEFSIKNTKRRDYWGRKKEGGESVRSL